MFLKKMMLTVALLSATAAYADPENKYNVEIQGGWLNLQPSSNNHTFAYYVDGTQPEFQDWHVQTINTSYSPTFDLGIRHSFKGSMLNASMDWIHLASSDSGSNQGNQTLNIQYIQFVGPPFEMSPPVFGIRHVSAELKYNYDNVSLHMEKIFEMSQEWLSAKIIGGINILRIKQDFSTTFSDLVGALPTDYSYPLPPDPSFSFNLHSTSEFIGLGPDLGLSSQLEIFKGLKIIGAAFGCLNVGPTSVDEHFKATSAELTRKGIGVSKQRVNTPNKTQVVPGFDSKIGLIYEFQNKKISNFTLEAGYRLISYLNAISTTTPQTLVQPGRDPSVPEFSTGTMAVVSMMQTDRPFNLNGPYITLKLDVL